MAEAKRDWKKILWETVELVSLIDSGLRHSGVMGGGSEESTGEKKTEAGGWSGSLGYKDERHYNLCLARLTPERRALVRSFLGWHYSGRGFLKTFQGKRAYSRFRVSLLDQGGGSSQVGERESTYEYHSRGGRNDGPYNKMTTKRTKKLYASGIDGAVALLNDFADAIETGRTAAHAEIANGTLEVPKRMTENDFCLIQGYTLAEQILIDQDLPRMPRRGEFDWTKPVGKIPKFYQQSKEPVHIHAENIRRGKKISIRKGWAAPADFIRAIPKVIKNHILPF